jgi:pyruvate/2-oxoglutarate dehydrogenase complex dihydrolipoamide dehydrogenase (E3) component
LSHKDVWTLQALPRSLVIVGAAATGCQLATIFATFGTQITLLERNPRILRVEDELVSRVVSRSFRQQGIEIIPGISGVEGIQKVPGGVVVTYTKDGAAVPLEAEGVVLSSGWLGNVDSLNLEAAGVKHERNYVIVDQHLRSSAEHIFAAGDITGRMMLVQSAGYEARAAAENAVLGIGERSHHQIVPHGGFTDPEYGSVGMTEEQAHAATEVVVATVPYASLDRAVIDDHTVGFCKLIVSRETHRILGAHIVGEQALETIQLVATGMAADMWVEQLAELELAYPTFTSIVGLAARKAVRELGVMPLAPQWLVLDRPHAEWERANLMEDEDLAGD